MPGISRDAARIDGIIAQAYECLLDPAGWDGLLTELAQFVGAESALIYVRPRSTGDGVLRTSLGFNPNYDIRRYSSYYEARSPLIARYRRSPVASVAALGDYAFSAEYRETEFFQDWVRPQRFADMLGGHLVRTPGLYAWMSVRRADDRGSYPAAAVKAANRLAPHLGRALKLGAALERQRCLAESALQSLDMVGVGVFVVDSTARLITTNSAADRLLRSGDGLRSCGGRLCCHRPQESGALQTAINAVSRTPDTIPAVATDMRVARTWAESPLAVLVLPVAAAPATAGLTVRAAAIVFAIDPDARTANVEGFAVVHGLTVAERRVLGEIVRCGGLVVAARALNISLPTARTHLQHIFGKTGTRSQAELVARVLCSPLRPRADLGANGRRTSASGLPNS